MRTSSGVRCWWCTDFDGTLSQIVLDPWAATILPLGGPALRRLAGMPGVFVVVLSGRTAGDVAARVRVGNVTYLGNHGMERGYLPRGGRPERMPATVASARRRRQRRAPSGWPTRSPALLPEPWLIVERKPPAVAFHYRQAPDVGGCRRRGCERSSMNSIRIGVLERFPGRRILELRPPGAIAKGEALKALIDEVKPGSVFMLGDDVSDALAFAVLRAEREARPDRRRRCGDPGPGRGAAGGRGDGRYRPGLAAGRGALPSAIARRPGPGARDAPTGCLSRAAPG